MDRGDDRDVDDGQPMDFQQDVVEEPDHRMEEPEEELEARAEQEQEQEDDIFQELEEEMDEWQQTASDDESDEPRSSSEQESSSEDEPMSPDYDAPLRDLLEERGRIYIRTLEIENFRHINKARLDFKEGFNMIVGDNGVGKSSVLDAIEIGLSAIHGQIAETLLSRESAYFRLPVVGIDYQTTPVIIKLTLGSWRVPPGAGRRKSGADRELCIEVRLGLGNNGLVATRKFRLNGRYLSFHALHRRLEKHRVSPSTVHILHQAQVLAMDRIDGRPLVERLQEQFFASQWKLFEDLLQGTVRKIATYLRRANVYVRQSTARMEKLRATQALLDQYKQLEVRKKQIERILNKDELTELRDRISECENTIKADHATCKKISRRIVRDEERIEAAERALGMARTHLHKRNDLQRAIRTLEARLRQLEASHAVKQDQIKRERIAAEEVTMFQQEIDALEAEVTILEERLWQAEVDVFYCKRRCVVATSRKQALVQAVSLEMDNQRQPQATPGEDWQTHPDAETLSRDIEFFRNMVEDTEAEIQQLTSLQDTCTAELTNKIEVIMQIDAEMKGAEKAITRLQADNEAIRNAELNALSRLAEHMENRLFLNLERKIRLRRRGSRLTQLALIHTHYEQILQQLGVTENLIANGFYGCILDHIDVEPRYRAAVSAVRQFPMTFLVANFNIAWGLRNILERLQLNFSSLTIILLDEYQVNENQRNVRLPVGALPLSNFVQLRKEGLFAEDDALKQKVLDIIREELRTVCLLQSENAEETSEQRMARALRFAAVPLYKSFLFVTEDGCTANCNGVRVGYTRPGTDLISTYESCRLGLETVIENQKATKLKQDYHEALQNREDILRALGQAHGELTALRFEREIEVVQKEALQKRRNAFDKLISEEKREKLKFETDFESRRILLEETARLAGADSPTRRTALEQADSAIKEGERELAERKTRFEEIRNVLDARRIRIGVAASKLCHLVADDPRKSPQAAVTELQLDSQHLEHVIAETRVVLDGFRKKANELIASVANVSQLETTAQELRENERSNSIERRLLEQRICELTSQLQFLRDRRAQLGGDEQSADNVVSAEVDEATRCALIRELNEIRIRMRRTPSQLHVFDVEELERLGPTLEGYRQSTQMFADFSRRDVPRLHETLVEVRRHIETAALPVLEDCVQRVLESIHPRGRVHFVWQYRAGIQPEQPHTVDDVQSLQLKAAFGSANRFRPASLLSGGQRSILSVAFLIGIQTITEASIFALDEVDASLSDQLCRKLAGALARFARKRQLIITSHRMGNNVLSRAQRVYRLTRDGTGAVFTQIV